MFNPWHLLIISMASAIAFAASVTYVLVLDADGPRVMAERGAVEAAVNAARNDCNAIYGTAYHSDEERAWFNENCSAWSKAVGDVPEPLAAAPPSSQARGPASPPPEGRDCGQVRGTAYRSDSERNWYMANCQGNQSSQLGTAAGPDRTNCDEIRGTAYRSDNERRWYASNCGAPQAPSVSAGPDRADCREIRGSAYRSDNERRWFQANCG